MTITSIFQQVFGFTVSKRSAGSTSTPATPTPTATQAAWTQAMIEADEQRAFMASIADLSAGEKQKRIARREWYRQLAERQGVVEAEQRAGEYWK